MGRSPQFQFSVMSLLLATTLVAIAVAALAASDLPWQHPAVQSFLLAYVLFIGIWAAFRGPAVVRNVRDFRRRKQALAETRAKIAEELRQARTAGATPAKDQAASPFQD
ncbi:MAG TPA: hypothetical protein VEQ85_01750 [Lacipirellulaceae bacterium]|nr:hypothetical protein [Lacipirellulaceae bacterium]